MKNQTCVEVVLAGIIGVSRLDELGADVMVVVEVIAVDVVAAADDDTAAVDTEVVVAAAVVADDIAVFDVAAVSMVLSSSFLTA
jgi:hypothetical protein